MLALENIVGKKRNNKIVGAVNEFAWKQNEWRKKWHDSAAKLKILMSTREH